MKILQTKVNFTANKPKKPDMVYPNRNQKTNPSRPNPYMQTRDEFYRSSNTDMNYPISQRGQQIPPAEYIIRHRENNPNSPQNASVKPCSEKQSQNSPKNNSLPLKIFALLGALGISVGCLVDTFFVNEDELPEDFVFPTGLVETVDYMDYEHPAMPLAPIEEPEEKISEAFGINEASTFDAAQALSENIRLLDKDHKGRIEKLMLHLNMDEKELMQYLINMCASSQFGNNCIDPIMFYGLMAQESNCDAKKVGDYNAATGEYRAVGLGQLHKIAVDEVNNQIQSGAYGDFVYNNGELYCYSDRYDAKKNIEISLLYLRYCDKIACGGKDEMLATYNTGNPDGLFTPKGETYVEAIYGQVDGE